MKCSFCGKHFEISNAIKLCEKCHKSSSCNLIRCPYCYYEIVVEPKWFTKLFGIFGKDKKETLNKCNVMLLTDIKKGSKIKIVNLLSDDVKTRRKLMAMGLLPGITIHLIQQYPSVVIKSGESQFAIDNILASMIEVESY